MCDQPSRADLKGIGLGLLLPISVRPRQWSTFEVELLQQSGSGGIALTQAELLEALSE